MTGFTFGKASKAKLIGVHPDLVLVVSRGLLYSPYDFAINDGVRTLERQKEYKAKGWSQTLNSKHLPQSDGFSHAIDVVAVGDLDGDGDVDAQDRALTWDREIYGAISIAMKRAADDLRVDIRWGGDWKSFFDGPHFELA